MDACCYICKSGIPEHRVDCFFINMYSNNAGECVVERILNWSAFHSLIKKNNDLFTTIFIVAKPHSCCVFVDLCKTVLTPEVTF